MSGCVFCEIVAGRAPATVVAKIGDSVLFVPLTPVTPGHVLVVPRWHVADASEVAAVTAETFMQAAVWARQQGRPFNLITSAGRAATQSIDHLHVHYVPRATDDDLMLPWGTLHGENPADPHLCRELRQLGRVWNEGPRDDWEAKVGVEFGELMDGVGDRAYDWDDNHREET